MLGNEVRNLLVQAYEKDGNFKYLATIFDVKKRTVYRFVAQKRATGSVELRTSTRGRKPKLNDKQIQPKNLVMKWKFCYIEIPVFM